MSRGQAGRVRLIGGRWRGRLLAVAEAPGLRPSPDRLRETLFNWLAPLLPGAHCLDLFAGTGALGLEAASRGAASVTLVERDAGAVALLRSAVDELEASDRVSVVAGDAFDLLASSTRRWDIVFVDPPFADRLQSRVLVELLDGALAPGARVHLETAVLVDTALPEAYEVLRDKRFGEVRARLLGTN